MINDGQAHCLTLVESGTGRDFTVPGDGNFKAAFVDGNISSDDFTTSWSDPGRTIEAIKFGPG